MLKFTIQVAILCVLAVIFNIAMYAAFPDLGMWGWIGSALFGLWLGRKLHE